MSAAIGKKSRLCKFLKDALTVSPEALNNMYILDKETKAFDFFATTVDSMKQKIDDCSALNDLLASKEVIIGDGLWDYMAGYRKLLEKMLVVLEGGVKIIETFKTEKNKAPYAVLHYDPYVKDVVSKHMLGTLSDPITSGTNYKTMARKMVDRLDELAWTVTKYAPD